MKSTLFNYFGTSNTMLVLDYMLDQPVDVTVLDISEGTGLSRKTVDQIVNNLIEQKLLEVTRTIGKTRMLQLDLNNPIAKKLLDINHLVIKEQEKKLENAILA